MTMSIAEKVSKAQKIQLIPVTERDPEAARKEMTKVDTCVRIKILCKRVTCKYLEIRKDRKATANVLSGGHLTFNLCSLHGNY